MAQSAMTVRLDSQMKMRFDKLCEQFGMSANTAINVFVNAVVRSNSIPFSIAIPSTTETAKEKALKAFDRINQKAAMRTDPELTLDEINEEIHLAREVRKER